MAESKPIKRRLQTLFRYGFKLTPGSIFKNKSGSVILALNPNSGSLSTGNIQVVLNSITVGHYSDYAGTFSYAGGKALQEAFPESRIKSVFSGLLRQYLNEEKDEFEDAHLGIKNDLYYNPLTMSFVALKALGLFEVPQTKWDLKFFEVESFGPSETISIRKKTTGELLAVLEQGSMTVHSKKITEDILDGVLFYLLEALGKWWADSGRIITEPVISEWVNPILGIRQITLDWLAWKVYGEGEGCNVEKVTQAIRTGVTKVTNLLAQEHNESSRSYVAETPRACDREFTVYRLTKQCVF